jgi:hypothetical protein
VETPITATPRGLKKGVRVEGMKINSLTHNCFIIK